jgi:HEAT repeat protein
VTDAELESRIALLELPLGGDPDQREKERAAEWLLTHAARTYPELLARARDGRAGPATVELLGRFGRADSVPALAALLEGGDDLHGLAAARALAGHPGPEALAALRQVLRSGGDGAVLAADALGARGDAAACPDLEAATLDRDPRLRYHAVQAAGSLGCLSPDRLAEIEASDPDADVRVLAGRLRHA